MNPQQPETCTKKKTSYPKGRMLVVRECVKAICLDNSPAAKLLSVLLYWYDHSDREAIDGLFTIVRTQAALVQDACEEITEKTIHDIAGPALQLLGFLDVEERMGGNRYTLHIDVIHEALRLYGEQRGQLEKFLIDHLQLEKFLIDVKRVVQLEKSLINRKNFLSELEKVLIANGNISNCKRGRKRKPKEPSDGNFPETENSRDLLETNTKREEERNNASPTSPPSEISSHTLSSSVISSVSVGSQGGVIISPASVKGVSLSSGGNATLVSASHSSVEGAISSSGDSMSASCPQSDHTVPPLCPQNDTHHDAPTDGAHTSYSRSSLHDSSIQRTDDQNEAHSGGGLYEEKNHRGMMNVDVRTGGVNQGDNALPANDAVLKIPPQVVSENDTPVDEIITQEMIRGWILSRGAEPGREASQQEALKKLQSLIKCEAHIGEIADIVKEQFANKRIYVKNFSDDGILARWKALRPSECRENGIAEDSEPYGMDAQTCNGVIDDILARYPEWEQVISLDERDAPVYFLGINLGNNQWIDIARPSDWYKLDKGILARIEAYVDWLAEQQREVMAV
jgi:hypothetical protein